jgi:hypothetical protein
MIAPGTSSSTTTSAAGFSPGLANPHFAPGTLPPPRPFPSWLVADPPPPPPPPCWTVAGLRAWGDAHRANVVLEHLQALLRGETPSGELVSFDLVNFWAHLVSYLVLSESDSEQC